MWILWMTSLLLITGPVPGHSSQCERMPIFYSKNEKYYGRPSECLPCGMGANEWGTTIQYDSGSEPRSLNVRFETGPCGCGFSRYVLRLFKDGNDHVIDEESFDDNYKVEWNTKTFKELDCGISYKVYVEPIFEYAMPNGPCCPNCQGKCSQDYCVSRHKDNIILECDDNRTSVGGSPFPTEMSSLPSPADPAPTVPQNQTPQSTAVKDPLPQSTAVTDSKSYRISSTKSITTENENNVEDHLNEKNDSDTQQTPVGESTKIDPVSNASLVLYPLLGVAFALAIVMGFFLCYIICKRRSLSKPSEGTDNQNNKAVPVNDSARNGCKSQDTKTCMAVPVNGSAPTGCKNQNNKTCMAVPVNDSAPTGCKNQNNKTCVAVPVNGSAPTGCKSQNNKTCVAVPVNDSTPTGCKNGSGEVNRLDQTKQDYITSRLRKGIVTKQSMLEELPPKRVFILYEDDHPLHKKVIQCLATYLQIVCNCDVIFDEWYMNQLGQDVLNWVFSEMDRADKCLIIISQGAHAKYKAQYGQIKIEYHRPHPKGDLFGPAIWMVKQEFHEKKNLNKYVHVSFPYSEKSICGQDFIIRDIYPRMHFMLMDHIENLVMNIHGLQMMSPGQFHAIDGISKGDFEKFEEGKALKMAIDEMLQMVKNYPNWYDDQCYTSVTNDSGLSTLHSQDYTSLKQSSNGQQGSDFAHGSDPNKDSCKQEEAALSSVLSDELFLPSTDIPEQNCRPGSQSMVDYEQEAEPIPENDTPSFLPGFTDLHQQCWINPEDIPDEMDIEMAELEGPQYLGINQLCDHHQNFHSNFRSRNSNYAFILPDQITLKSANLSEIVSIIDNRSPSDVMNYFSIKDPLDDYNDEDSYSV